MWKVEYAVKNHLTGIACTDEQASWNRGTTRNVTPSAIANIPFKKPRRDAPVRDGHHTPAKPTIIKYQSHNEFLAAVDNFRAKDLCHLPKTLIGQCITAEVTKHTQDTVGKVHQQHNGEERDCTICGEFYKKYIDIHTDSLEEATRHQSASVVWKDSRRIRITASTANKVPKRSTTNPDKFIREHLFPKFQGNRATRHGQVEEVHAKQFYAEHFNVNIQDKGSVMRDDNKWLSASPDGIVEGQEILEVKCPDTNDLDLLIAGGKYDVKKDAKGTFFLDPKGTRGYYVQIQLTMYCCNSKKAKLLIWRDRDNFKVVNVDYDLPFITNTVSRLKTFYFTKLLPRIVDDHNAKRLVISSHYTALSSM
jgi:hypothetical protein